MAIVVQKYGGSSVADIERLKVVADHVERTRAAGHDVVVAVSAMGKTTENLLALARQAAERPDGTGTPEPPRRELDMLVSTGERVSMALLSIALQARGCDAISFTGSQSGIITNDRHFDARIIEVRPHRIEDELSRGRVVIVAGYQGMSYKREITTLGRGGTDTTAVALAAALGAERCEIYSDVDGVYSADPRSVPDARHLPELDYETMQEMAESGARVLNAQAVEWARRHRITIHARRTSDTQSAAAAARETLVMAETESLPRAVVVQRGLCLISVARSHGAELLEGCAAAGLPIRDTLLLGERAAVLVPLANVPDFAAAHRALAAAELPALTLDDGLGSVSLVGVGVGTESANVSRALAGAGECRWFATSPMRISCLRDESDLAEVERRWHDTFVAQPAQRLSA